jgi:hypothetical protein
MLVHLGSMVGWMLPCQLQCIHKLLSTSNARNDPPPVPLAKGEASSEAISPDYLKIDRG